MQLELNVFELPKCGDTFKASERARFGVDHNAFCDHIEVCCPRLPDWPDTLSQAGGYEFDVARRSVRIPPLPALVCAINGDQGHRPFMASVNDRVWAVKYQSAVAGDMNLTDRLDRWRHSQGIPPSKWLLLHQESDDTQLDRLFRKTYHPNFFAMIRASRNTICIAPGYSVYDDGSMCRHHQLLNLKRSIDFFVRATDSGVRCIPSFGWSLREDMGRLADWVNAHPQLRYVALNCQTLRQGQLPKLRSDMEFIEHFSRPLQWVLFGGRRVVSYLNRSGFAGRTTLITAAPIQCARAGRSIDRMWLSQGRERQIDLFLYNHALMLRAVTQCQPHFQQ